MQWKDSMNSIAVADCIIDALLEKVAHKKYLDEIDEKLKPYTVIQSTLQGLRVLELQEMKAD